MSKAQRILLIGLVVALIAGIPLVTASIYTVDQRQLAVVLQFGQPVVSRTEPGLYFKVPFVQEVARRPKTLQLWSARTNERLVDLPTADGKKIEVTPWAVWKITDPKQFGQMLRTTTEGGSRVQTIVRSAVRDVIGRYDLAELVRSSNRPLTFSFQVQDIDGEPPVQAFPLDGEQVDDQLPVPQPGSTQRITLGREKIVAEIREEAQRGLRQTDGGSQRNLGIELVDVGIARIDFVPAVRKAAFDRLIALMESIAARYTNEGQRRKQEILNQTNADVQRIEGEGSEAANRIRGNVDAEIIDMYAEAINETGEFYNFIRTLEAYSLALTGNTRLILTTNSDFLRLIKQFKTDPGSRTSALPRGGN